MQIFVLYGKNRSFNLIQKSTNIFLINFLLAKSFNNCYFFARFYLFKSQEIYFDEHQN